MAKGIATAPALDDKDITEEKLLASYYGKKPAEMCPDMQVVFNDVIKIGTNVATVEELRLLVAQINIIIKSKTENKEKNRKETKRHFYQIKDKKGCFFWYFRERGEDGKLKKLKYFGLRLPADIDLKADRVSFHPLYLAERHNNWVK